MFWKKLQSNLKLFWRRHILRKVRHLFLKIYNLLLRYIGKIVAKIQVLENWMISKKNLPKTGMRDLSPTLIADKDRGYSNILKWALENKSIKNLAISGPYGSGKSSIIKIFQHRHPEYHYLNISLASFKDEKKPKVEVILLSILQQIFYYVKSQSMPDSRYKRINPISKKALLFKSTILVLCSLSLCFLIKPEWFKLSKSEEDLIKNYEWIRYFFVALVIGGGVAILYYFLRVYNNFQLNKLNIASGQLEIQPKSESSILNRYLDEILYFFEISKYDVVVIEDLDRFTLENTEVFTKLRELNTLINNAQQIGRHVTFIYAVRDEIFKKEERTKFFDFILPVIPVINSSNSGDQLSIQLADAGFSGKIDANFISKLSDYITDMRILINIMNEFLVYKNTIGNFGYEPNNLLAMIVYKNIEPDDFALLQKDDGDLFKFINQRQEYNDPLTSSLNEQYKKLSEDITSIEDTAVANIQELRSLYVFVLYNRLQTNATGQIDFGSGFKTLKQLIDDTNFALVRSARTITFRYGDSYGISNKTQNYSFSEIENEVGHGQDYEFREKLIRIKADNLLEEQKKELELTQEKINKIRFAKVKELSGINHLVAINPIIKDKKLLIYLFEQGYIDEHYRNYISYFYGESMTSADRDFIMGINYNRTMDMSFELNKVHEIVKKLTLQDFSKPQVVNTSLLNFILGDMQSYSDQIVRIFAQISNNSTYAKDVREEYRKNGTQKGNFMYHLTKSWTKLWEYIQLESNYSEPLKQKYLEDILNFASLEDIASQNQNALLSTYISQIENFQQFKKGLTNQAHVDNVLKRLNVQFEKLSNVEDKHLINLLLQENLYKINPHMMNLIIGFSANKRSKSKEGIDTFQYTFLKEFSDNKILSYVEANLDSYISDVLLKLEGNSEESEITMMDLLNRTEVQTENRIKFLAKQKVRVQNLYKIEEKELWLKIIQLDKIVPTWHNVTTYFQQVEQIDKVIADYLNLEHNFKMLETVFVIDDTDVPEEGIDDFCEAVITSQLISDVAIEHLVKSMQNSFSEINLTGVSGHRVDTLIKNSSLEMTKKNYELLKASHEGKNIGFLELVAEEWPDWISKLLFDANDYKLLFTSEVITSEDKFNFSESMPLEILEKDNNLANLLSGLYAPSSSPVPDALFDAIISNSSFPEFKVQMAMQQASNFNSDRYRDLLPLMGESYSAILTEPKVAKLENTGYNLAFGEFLQRSGIISSVTGKEDPDLRFNLFQRDRN